MSPFHALALPALLFAGGAQAATTLVFSVTENARESSHQLRISPTQAVLWSADAGKPDWVYDTASDTLSFLDHRDHVFTNLTESWAKDAQQRVKQSMAEMKKKADEQSKDMTPQARAQYQQGMDMMRLAGPFLGGFLNAPARTSMPSFRSAKVADIECQEVRVLEKGELVQQLCVAPTDALQLSAEEKKTLDGLLRLSRVLVQQNAFYFGFATPKLAAGDQGLAIAVKEGKDGWLLRSREPAGDEDFTIPSGYLEGRIPLPGIP
ncbi:MAG: hypothetical protein LJE84_12070 [Gammaproteobacteria bacterium]|jgi:hypothetical protein|nr:hypothetical protein [Gammaproteobacteria bacterium]